MSQDPVAVEIRQIGLLIEANDLALAEARALTLLRTHARRPDAHNIMGVIRVRQKQSRMAVPHFEFAVKAEPDNAHYLNNLGRLYVDLRLIELALPFLQKALAINPHLPSALLAIGKYYNNVGKAELALPYLERLQKQLPEYDSVKLELAESLDALGVAEEANKLYGELRHTKAGVLRSLYYFARNGSAEDRPALIRE